MTPTPQDEDAKAYGEGGLGGGFFSGSHETKEPTVSVTCDAPLPLMVSAGDEVVRVGTVDAHTPVVATHPTVDWVRVNPPRSLRPAKEAHFLAPRSLIAQCEPVR